MRALAVVLALLATACSTRVSSTADAAPRDVRAASDRRPADTPSPTQDSDGDGVCDATELTRRTDPSRPDSDGDGLIDGFELRYGSDPVNLNNPSMRDRLRIDEQPGSEWPLPWSVQLTGMGEGMMVALLDRVPGVDGRRVTEVSDFALEAVGADPVAFIGGVDGPRFVTVRGTARLEWRITARWRDLPGDGGAPVRLGCRRAYEALAIVKTDEGETVAARRLVLDVSPPFEALDGGAVAWPAGATDEGHCRYADCI